ncbi:MAG: bifunctional DNA-binding transcriptional regulator/O6-methylguanine-DNA methyltransferase Ada [Anaerolineales bacterium]|nr:MAG: bifunctional DNA-binding transcriptional regulator/O6-methylguanine-DNA methyltransferase Ada [Anaerolineales bacterium]
MVTYKTEEARWAAVAQRDQKADGQFVYAVTTTGIYCRPDCASKLPKRGNVLFFDTSIQAETAGFRPCKRCHPQGNDEHNTHQHVIIAACRRIAEAHVPPTLKELARDAGYSPTYFHRLFKKFAGVTPRQYAVTVRDNRVRSDLQSTSNITEAIYEAGFNSSSQFYDTSADTLGMQPSSYRQGGTGAQIRYTVAPCYLGWILIAATMTGICAIEFAGDAQSLEHSLRAKFPQAQIVDNDKPFERMVNQVLTYLDTPRDNLDLPLDIRGTVFQQRVWQALRQIPPGAPVSYSHIAENLNQPTAARAVAQACAANKIAVAIPCHRVVRADGGLGGYRWGIERKRALLEKEAEEYTQPE